MGRVKEYMPAVFLWRKLKIQFPFLVKCLSHYKHKDIHVKFLAEAKKARTVKITLQLDFKVSFSLDLLITCEYLSQETEKGEPKHHCFSVWLWGSRGQPGAPVADTADGAASSLPAVYCVSHSWSPLCSLAKRILFGFGFGFFVFCFFFLIICC